MKTPSRTIQWEPVCVMLGIIVLAAAVVGFIWFMRFMLTFATPEQRIASVQKEHWVKSCIDNVSEQDARSLIVCEHAAESVFSINAKY